MMADEENKTYFYVRGFSLNLLPEDYAPVNNAFSLVGANVRLGPPLDLSDSVMPAEKIREMSQYSLLARCGLYLRKEDIIDFDPNKKNLSLDDALMQCLKSV